MSLHATYLQLVGQGKIDWENADIKAILLYENNGVTPETRSLSQIPVVARACAPIALRDRKILLGGIAKCGTIVFQTVPENKRRIDTMCIFAGDVIIGTWNKELVDIFPFVPNGGDVVIEVDKLFQL